MSRNRRTVSEKPIKDIQGNRKRPEGGICPTRKLSDTGVLRQSRASLGWVLSDNFRVGQLPASQKDPYNKKKVLLIQSAYS